MTTQEFWLDVLDQYGNLSTQFQPELGGTITIAADKMIARTLTGLMLKPGDTLSANQRLRPMVSVNGTESPLGVFLPTLGARHRRDDGIYTEVNGHDLGYLIGQTLHTAYGVALGANVADAITDLLVLAGITDVSIPDLGDTAGTFLAWPPGAPINDALDAMLRLVSLYGHVDRTGAFVARPLPYVGVDAPVGSWQSGEASRIGPEPVEVSDTWDVPNTWWVVSGSESIAVAGKHELADDHPMSFVSRGFRNVVTMEVPGLLTTAECEQRARDEAQRDPNVHSTVELTCDLDPTIEPLDVRSYLDADWLVDSASITCQVGALMAVRLRTSLVGDQVELAA